MELMAQSSPATVAAPVLSLSMATTHEAVRDVQRLRYKVFVEQGGLSNLANADRLDRDEFDDYCDHLIVRDTGTHEAVGTYRVLNPAGACRIGRLYSESEFDLSGIDGLRSRVVEAGRACIAPQYRSGAVIMQLWTGLASYMRQQRCDYLVGCASLGLEDGGLNAAEVYRGLAAKHLAPVEYRVTPHVPFPTHRYGTTGLYVVPPLLKGYLRSGAWLCGEPAWDPAFNCADLFLLLRLSNMDARYARRYFAENHPPHADSACALNAGGAFRASFMQREGPPCGDKPASLFRTVPQ